MGVFKKLLRRKRPSLDKKSIQTITDEADYIKVVNDYGTVLTKSEKFSHAMPESILPYKKPEIKKAIKLALEDCDDDWITKLKFAYISLAYFIPDNDAYKVNVYWDEFQSMQSKHKDSIEDLKRYMDSRGIETSGEMIDIWRKINENSEMLHKEIIDFLNSIDK